MVLFGHTLGFLYQLSPTTESARFLQGTIRKMQPFGPIGVELFFVLSGFLIGNILIKTFLNSTTYTFADVRNFWVRRWMRTLPVYWLILTVLIFLYKFMGFQGLDSWKLWYYFFAQNLFYPHPIFFFGEAWSLSVEEWFYLTLPLAMLIAAKVFRPVKKKQFLLSVFLGYLFVFILIRFLNAFHPAYGPDQDTGIRKVVLLRFDAVMYGVIMAWLHTFHKVFFYKARYVFLGVFVAGFSFFYYLYLNLDILEDCAAHNLIIFLSDSFFYLFLPLFLSCCLPLANTIGDRQGKLPQFFRYISKISYSLYLVHYSLIFIPFFSRFKPDTDIKVAVEYTLYLGLTFIFATLMYRFVESPVMAYRDRVFPPKTGK